MIRDAMVVELQDVLNANPGFSDWAESRLIGYLAEGQDKFCEDTGFFVDTTNFPITLQTGVAVYAVPPRVIQILDIWDGTHRLHKDQVGEDHKWHGWQFTPTRPRRWRTDRDTGLIKLEPTPSINENGLVFMLQVWRYSMYDLAGDGAVPGVAALPEIPARLQRACIEWAAYQAFNHRDADTQDPVKADEHGKRYKEYVRDGIQLFRQYHGVEAYVGTDRAYRT